MWGAMSIWLLEGRVLQEELSGQDPGPRGASLLFLSHCKVCAVAREESVRWRLVEEEPFPFTAIAFSQIFYPWNNCPLDCPHLRCSTKQFWNTAPRALLGPSLPSLWALD